MVPSYIVDLNDGSKRLLYTKSADFYPLADSKFAALLCELIFGQNTKFQEALQKTVKAPVALR